MLVDIGERVREISAILSFLRVLRSAAIAQPPTLGFFVSINKPDFTAFATLVSVVTVLGPFSYAVLGMYEIGRLDYFGAPFDFMQLGSFGIADVILKAYPVALPICACLVFAYRVTWLSGPHRLFAIIHTVLMFSLLIVGVVINPKWKMAWGCVAVLTGLYCFFKGPPEHSEPGNEIERAAPIIETRDQRFWRRARRVPAFGLFTLVLMWLVSAYGAKEAQTQTYYWHAEGEVVLGFYGDKALTAKFQDGILEKVFYIRNVQDLKGLRRFKLGPLSVSPAWQASRNYP